MVNNALGVIGGLGPMATARFLELVTAMTDAETDQQHIPMLIYSCPAIPDRTACILDPSKPSPLPAMLDIGNRLVRQGATVLAIPCFSAHYFYDSLAQGVPVPVIHGIRETALRLKEQGAASAGLLATSGSIRSRLFQQELEALGIRPILPAPERQEDVMHLIYRNLKAGLPPEEERFFALKQDLQRQGAETIILGCTELSLLERYFSPGPGCLDALAVLARQAVLRCGGRLKPRYRDLITT